MITYYVGQKLWCVPPDKHDSACEVTVVKIGNKWVELSNREKVEKNSVRVHNSTGRGWSYLGTLYLSKEDYEAKLALNKEWDCLRKRFEWSSHMPKNMTLEKIKQIEDLLGE